MERWDKREKGELDIGECIIDLLKRYNIPTENITSDIPISKFFNKKSIK